MDCIRCGNPVEDELIFPFAQCLACNQADAEKQEDEQRQKELIANYWSAHPFWQANALRLLKNE
jgi:recombinational DNA repair protein (RecF pathway)